MAVVVVEGGRRRMLDVPVIVRGVEMWIVIGERVESPSSSGSSSSCS